MLLVDMPVKLDIMLKEDSDGIVTVYQLNMKLIKLWVSPQDNKF